MQNPGAGKSILALLVSEGRGKKLNQLQQQRLPKKKEKNPLQRRRKKASKHPFTGYNLKAVGNRQLLFF
jgi:hypothetical protein